MQHRTLALTTLMFLVVIGCIFSPALRAQEAAREPAVKTGEPESSFQKADRLFLKKDLKAAASEIRKGAEFLKEKAMSATKESKEGLATSVQELEKLAKEVEKGAVTSEKQLKDTFAKSYHALANYEYREASETWAKKKAKETGQALTKAAQYVEDAAKWSSRKLEKGTADTIGFARVVGDKLVKGAGWTADEVEKGIKGIRNALSKLGEKTESKG